MRISGASGHYSAVVKMSDGKEVTVHVGDHLSDGSTVLGITASSVAFKKDDAVRQVRISGMDVVYGQAL